MKKKLLLMLLTVTTAFSGVSTTAMVSAAEFTSGDCFTDGAEFVESVDKYVNEVEEERYIEESMTSMAGYDSFLADPGDPDFFKKIPTLTTVYEETPIVLSTMGIHEGYLYYKFTAPRESSYRIAVSIDREKLKELDESDISSIEMCAEPFISSMYENGIKTGIENYGSINVYSKAGETTYFRTGIDNYLKKWSDIYLLTIADVYNHTHKHQFTGYSKTPGVFTTGIASYRCIYCDEYCTKEVGKVEPILTFREPTVETTAGKSNYYHNFFEYVEDDSIKSITLKDPSIAKITVSHDKSNQHHCTVKGLKGGSTTAIITLASGLKKELPVNVKYPESPNAKLSASTITLKVPQTTNIKVTGLTKGDAVKSYASSNKKVFVVDSKGKITAKAKGTAKLTVTLGSGKKLTATVKVSGIVKTTKLTVNKKSVTLTRGKTFQIKATKAPAASQEKITYASSKKSVATVSSTGKIVAKKKGIAYIKVKSGSKYVRIKVIVK